MICAEARSPLFSVLFYRPFERRKCSPPPSPTEKATDKNKCQNVKKRKEKNKPGNVSTPERFCLFLHTYYICSYSTHPHSNFCLFLSFPVSVEMGLVLFLHFVLEEKTWIESTTSRNRCDVRLHCLLLTIYYFNT